MKPTWRIYYSDGSTFDSSMGEPVDAPTEGFICAVGYDFMGARYIQSGYDFYCWSPGEQRWWGVSVHGLHDLLRRNELVAYKEGRTIPKMEFHKMMEAADTDPDFLRSGKPGG